MEAYFIAVAFSVALISAAVIGYARLYLANLQTMKTQDWEASLVDLFSHIPDENSGPKRHIVSGLFLVSGISLLVGTVAADSLTPESFVSNMIGFSGISLSVSFSAISLWTLWQTRRIEYLSGFKIVDFYSLIQHLDVELEELINSFAIVYDKRAQPFHRVYLVTTHPFLGRLSFPKHEATRHFIELMRSLADLHVESLQSRHPFEFKVICGDTSALRQFVEQFYAGTNYPKERVQQEIDSVEIDIRSINERATSRGGSPPFMRASRVPPVQFMIIGNKLFEFTLDSQDSQSEIFNTQVVRDKRFCKAYIETFEILQTRLAESPQSHQLYGGSHADSSK